MVARSSNCGKARFGKVPPDPTDDPSLACFNLPSVAISDSPIVYSSFKKRAIFVYLQSSFLMVGNPSSRNLSKADCLARRRSLLSLRELPGAVNSLLNPFSNSSYKGIPDSFVMIIFIEQRPDGQSPIEHRTVIFHRSDCRP